MEQEAKDRLGADGSQQPAGSGENGGQNTPADPFAALMAQMEQEAKDRLGADGSQQPAPGGQNDDKTDAEITGFSSKYAKGTLLLDTYRIDSGQIDGGMGSVWKVRHTGWNVDLAMKQPQAQMFTDDGSRENFIAECQAWIDLGLHPNIVACYYVREIDGIPTIFSEWMENGSLEDHIKDKSLYVGADIKKQINLLHIAIQFARGLRYAHDCGLIHRDVKPDNVLLTNNLEAKISDFGLVKAKSGYTPAYCSMEQMEGRPLTIRTDIYSWAVSVMEMYKGSIPWANGVVAGLNCREYLEDCEVPVPEQLKQLLISCMAADPDDRPKDFAVIEKELLDIFASVVHVLYFREAPKAARETADSLNNRALSYLDLDVPEEAEKNWNRGMMLDPANPRVVYNRYVYMLRKGSVSPDYALRQYGITWNNNFCNAETGELYFRLSMEAGKPLDPFEMMSKMPDENEAEKLSARLKENVPPGYELSVIRTLEDTDKAEMRYAERESKIKDHLLRDEYPEAAVLMCETISDPVYQPCLNRPEWIALNEEIGKKCIPYAVRAWYPSGLIADVRPGSASSFSRDGSVMLLGNRLIDMETGTIIADNRIGISALDKSLQFREPDNITSHLSPDGSFYLCALKGKPFFQCIDAKTGEEKFSCSWESGSATALLISPDGSRLVSADDGNKIRTWTADGQKLETYTVNNGTVLNMFMCWDNSRLIIQSTNCFAVLEFDTADYRIITDYDGYADCAVNDAFTRMAISLGRGGLGIVDPEDTENSKVWNAPFMAAENHPLVNVTKACFMPNDQFLFLQSRDLHCYAPDPQRGLALLNMTDGVTITSIAVSPDGKYLVYGTDKGYAELWRLVYLYIPLMNGLKNADELRERYAAALENITFMSSVSKKISVYEDAYNSDTSPERLLPYAWLTAAGKPDKTPENLLPDFIKELQRRNLGFTLESAMIAALKDARVRLGYSQPEDRDEPAKRDDGPEFLSGRPVFSAKPDRADEPISFDAGSETMLFLCGQKLYGIKTGDIINDSAKGRKGLEITSGLSPEGDFFLRAKWKENAFEKVDPVSGSVLAVCERGTEPLVHLLISYDGKMLISSYEDGSIGIWDGEGKFLRSTVSLDPDIRGLFLTPDNKRLYIQTGRKMIFVETETKRMNLISAWPCESGWRIATDSLFSDFLYAKGSAGLAVYDAARPIEKGFFPDIPADLVCFLPGSMEVLCAYGNSLSVWDLVWNQCLGQAELPGAIERICASESGRYLAASVSGCVYVWDRYPEKSGSDNQNQESDTGAQHPAGSGQDAGSQDAGKTDPDSGQNDPVDPIAALMAEMEQNAAERLGASGARQPAVSGQTGNETAPSSLKLAKGSLLLDTYRVESDQIDGGMGSVWKVRHTGWDVDLAMKRPKPDLFADELSRHNFIQECEVWVNLGLHPNIVSCYYVREIESIPTIFSEWMDNGDLEGRIKDGSLYKGSDREVQARLLDIAIQFARGLRYAHESGLIHQDVKPANLLLTKDWDAGVSDFGLAKARGRLNAAGGPEDNTATHVAANGAYTPAYCSMEQMDRKTLTRRTDIYSWAVSVMEMYYGSCPWANGVVAGMNCRNYLDQSKIPVPPKLKSLLMNCMETEPEKRPESMGDVESALCTVYREVTGKPYPRPQPKAAPDTADSLNNRALSFLDLGRPEEADRIWSQTALKFPAHTNTLFNHTLFLVRSSQMSLYEGQCYLSANWENHFNEAEPGLLLAQLSLEFGDQHTVQDVLDYLSQNCVSNSADTPERIRQFRDQTGRDDYRCTYEISRVQNRTEQEAFDRKCDEKLSELNSLAEAGDYNQASLELFTTYMSREYPDAIYRPDWLEFYEKLSRKCFPVHVISQWPLMSVPDVNENDRVSFSDDSNFFLCGERLFDLRTGEMIADNRTSPEVHQDELDNIRNVLNALGINEPLDLSEGFICSTISPDGSFYLRAIAGGIDFRKVDAHSGQNLADCSGHIAPVTALAISRDGKLFASGDDNGTVRVWNSDGSFVKEMSFSIQRVQDIQFSYDNRKLILLYRYSVVMADLADDSSDPQFFIYNGHMEISSDLSYRNLALAMGDNGLQSYNIAAKEFTKHEDEIAAMRGQGHGVKSPRSVCVMPNDHFVLFGDRKMLCFFDMQSDRTLSAIHMPDEITQISCSRDMKYVAAVSGGKAQIWQVMYAYRWIKPEDALGFDVPGACAWVRISADSEKSSAELLPGLMTELTDRGFGIIPQDKALALLEKTRKEMESQGFFKPLSAADSGSSLSSVGPLSVSQDGDNDSDPGIASPVTVEKAAIPGADEKSKVMLSPDGKRIYILDEAALICLSADSMSQRYKTAAPFVVLGDVKITSDGRYLLCCGLSKDGFSLTVIDTADGSTLHCLTGHKSAVNAVVPHPDCRHCYTASADGTVRKWNYLTGTCELVSEDINTKIWNLCLSPDGKTICIRAGEDWHKYSFSFLDAETLKKRKKSEEMTYNIFDMEFSADSSRVILCSSDGIFAISADDLSLEKLNAEGKYFLCMGINSNRSKCLAGCLYGEIRLFDLLSGHSSGIISCGEENYISAISASKDLSVIACCIHNMTWFLLKNPFVSGNETSSENQCDIHNAGTIVDPGPDPVDISAGNERFDGITIVSGRDSFLKIAAEMGNIPDDRLWYMITDEWLREHRVEDNNFNRCVVKQIGCPEENYDEFFEKALKLLRQKQSEQNILSGEMLFVSGEAGTAADVFYGSALCSLAKGSGMTSVCLMKLPFKFETSPSKRKLPPWGIRNFRKQADAVFVVDQSAVMNDIADRSMKFDEFFEVVDKAQSLIICSFEKVKELLKNKRVYSVEIKKTDEGTEFDESDPLFMGVFLSKEQHYAVRVKPDPNDDGGGSGGSDKPDDDPKDPFAALMSQMEQNAADRLGTNDDQQPAGSGQTGNGIAGFAIGSGPTVSEIASVDPDNDPLFDQNDESEDLTPVEAEKKLIPFTDAESVVVLSPDGQWIYILNKEKLRCLAAETMEQRYEAEVSFIVLGKVEISADGLYLLCCGLTDESFSLTVIDTADGKKLRCLSGYKSAVNDVALHPDGKHCFVGYGDGVVRKWDFLSGVCEKESENCGSKIWDLCLSPDGKTIFIRCGDEWTETVFSFLDAEKLSIKKTSEKLSYGVYDMFFSADGTRVFFCDSPGGYSFADANLDVDTPEVEGIPFFCLKANAGRKKCLLGGMDGEIRLLESETARCLGIIDGREGNLIEKMSVSKDISLIAAKVFKKNWVLLKNPFAENDPAVQQDDTHAASPQKSDDNMNSNDPFAALLAGLEQEAQNRIDMEKRPGTGARNSGQNDNPAFSKGKTLLGTYRIDSDQINGGMGSVWKVHHTGWNVDLAMKRPQPQMFADETSKTNFINECQYWIRLGFHPNIVSCYYVREIEGVPTIFSEWMDNGSLENRIQDRSLYLGDPGTVQARLLDIAIQYARGLRYAHESGLIHRDVKPDNLLLSKDWQAKAADFGLVKARAQLTLEDNGSNADKRATQMAGKNIYTPAYCSMEQMDGQVLTRSTDIYSWAVSVMEMYYGSVPWVNGVVAGINCHDYLSDPKGRIPVPQALRDLLSRCMETDREKRPQDFSLIEKELLTIYRNVTGIVYFRPEPKAAADTADSLNNRALSFLDLDMPQKAVEFWESALKKDPGNAQVIFNRALYSFRSGQASINQAEDMLSSIQDTDIRAECIEALRNEKGELRLKMRWMDCRVLDVSEDGRFACGLEWDAYNMKYHPDIPNSNQLYLMPKADAEKDILTEEDGEAAEIWEDELNTETPDMVDSGTGSNCMSLSGNGRFLAVTQTGEDDDEEDEEYGEETMSTSVWEIPQPDTMEGYFQEVDFDEDNLVRSFPFGGGILNRDGSMIAFQLMNEDSEIDGIQICETKSGKKLKRLSSDLYFLDFTPQGNLAVLNVEEDELSIITPTGKICPGTKKMKGLKEAFWSFRRNALLTENESRLCVFSEKQCYYWNTQSGELLHTFSWKEGKPIEAIFMDDNRIFIVFRIETNSEGGKNHHTVPYADLYPWDTRNGKPGKNFEYIYIASVWDLSTGNLVTGEEADFTEISERTHVESIFRLMKGSAYMPRFLPGKKAEFRVSVIEKTEMRLLMQSEYDQAMTKAADAKHRKDRMSEFRALSKALSLPGYENDEGALVQWKEAGNGLPKCGIRQMVLLDHWTNRDQMKNSSGPKRDVLVPFTSVLEEVGKEIKERFGKYYGFTSRRDGKVLGDAVYSEPVNYSEDKRFLLVRNKTEERRQYGLRREKFTTVFHGAVILDTRTKQVIWRRDALICTGKIFYDIGYRIINKEYCPTDGTYPKTLPEDQKVTMQMDPSGSYVLTADQTLRVYDVNSGDCRILSQDGPFRDAFFLDHGSLILCVNQKEVIRVLDVGTGVCRYEYSLPWGEYQGVRKIDDDHFYVSAGKQYRTCHIQWDYRLTDGSMTGTPGCLPVEVVPDPYVGHNYTGMRGLMQNGLKPYEPVLFSSRISSLQFIYHEIEDKLFMDNLWLINDEQKVYEQIDGQTEDDKIFFNDCIVDPLSQESGNFRETYQRAKNLIDRRQKEADILMRGLERELLITVGKLSEPVECFYFPALSALAETVGMPNLCFAEMPFESEGNAKRKFSEESLAELRKHADMVIVLDPDEINRKIAGKSLALADLFTVMNKSWACLIRNYSRLVVLPENEKVFTVEILKTSEESDFDKNDVRCMGSIFHKDQHYYVYLRSEDVTSASHVLDQTGNTDPDDPFADLMAKLEADAKKRLKKK